MPTTEWQAGHMVDATDPGAWTAIVLAGGGGHRLGGVDKAALNVDGAALLDHVIDDLPPDVPVVVAGPERPTHRAVEFRNEEPPGSGPVAGIAAALGAVGTTYVAIMAVDIPRSPRVVVRLVEDLASAPEVDAVIPMDSEGRRQLLCCVWRTKALASALRRLGDPSNRSVRELVEGSRVLELSLAYDEQALLADIDTPDDLLREQRRYRRPTLGDGVSAG